MNIYFVYALIDPRDGSIFTLEKAKVIDHIDILKKQKRVIK